MAGLIDDDTGLAFGSGLQFQTPIGGAGLVINGGESQAEIFAGDEPNIIVLDFTDDFFEPSTGQWGSAFVRMSSQAEIFAGDEPNIVVLDFTDSSYAVETGQYGSAFVRES